MPGFCSPLIYTDAYTFGFENWLISVAFPNVREQVGFGTLISAVNKRSLVRLKSDSKTFENQKILANTSIFSHIFRQKG